MARPKFQQGSIERHGLYWKLRYYNHDGKRERAELGLYSSHPFELNPKNEAALRDIYRDRIKSILAPINAGNTDASGTATVGEFIEQSYYKRLEWRMKAEGELHVEPSTVQGYKDIGKLYVKNKPVSKIRLRDFTPVDARRYVEAIPQDLSHQTHLRVMNFLRGVFTWAIQDGSYNGPNPFNGIKVGGSTRKRKHAGVREQKIQESNTHAYTLEEVANMLEKLPDPARTVCAVAAFTGLSRSELWGLKWDDYDGEEIQVRRKIVDGIEGRTKTEAREDGVPVVMSLRKILVRYKKRFPPVKNGWLFRGERFSTPLNLDNVSRRDIPQHINGAWFGWHAFRRGLSTRLSELGVDAKVIQKILRHAQVSTTQDHYILPTRDSTEQALKKLDKVYRSK